MPASPSASMQLDVLAAKPGDDLFEACPKLRDIRCFTEYVKDPDPAIDPQKLVAYVVMLYSKDSILSRKPMEDLPNRRLKAARMAGLDSDDSEVIYRVFELGQVTETKTRQSADGKNYTETTYHNRISDLIADYLIYQNHYPWANRMAIEAQMDENLRIRLRPIDTSIDDDKIIGASSKKSLLTDHFDKYEEKVKNIDKEIFIDHNDVNDKLTKRKRVTLEGQV